MKRMKCVFLDDRDECYAELTRVTATWKVDEETKKQFCTMNQFEACPRFRAKMDFLTKAHIRKVARKK